ncbi:MAG: FAD-binding protein, partial [Endozoicomonas sp.]
MQTPFDYDVIIIGSGAAGLTSALLMPDHFQIAVFSKHRLTAGSTYGAQGGVAAVLDQAGDSIEQHISDTLIAGAGLCHEPAVRHIVENGRASIEWLIEQGVPFTEDNDQQRPYEFHLTREGGHSSRRIIHAADATGQAISNTLLEQAENKANIDLYENHLAIDLITTSKLGMNDNRCAGTYFLNLDTDHTQVFRSRCTI